MASTLSQLAQNSAVTDCSFDYLTRSELYDAVKPYNFAGALGPEQESHRSNLTYTTHDGIKLKDLRGSEHLLNLETHGFELLRDEPKANLDEPSDEDLATYLEETAAFLKQHLDAEFVMAYNFRFRKAPKPAADRSNGVVGTFGNPDKAILAPHTDQTMAGGPRRARRHLSEDQAAKYLDGSWRVRLLNVWRPVVHGADERPLAMCDFSSIDQADLRPADRASVEFTEEIYYLHHNPDQQWYWISGQRPEEMLLFVNYDSMAGNAPAYMAHSSFVNRMASKDVKPRKSLEIGVMVITRK